MVATIHDDDAVVLREKGDLVLHRPDVPAITMDQQQRRTRAIDLVIERHAVMREGPAGRGVVAIDDRAGRRRRGRQGAHRRQRHRDDRQHRVSHDHDPPRSRAFRVGRRETEAGVKRAGG